MKSTKIKICHFLIKRKDFTLKIKSLRMKLELKLSGNDQNKKENFKTCFSPLLDP